MDLIKIGNFIAELRKKQKLTQEQLGEKLGVTNKTVSRWETGTYLPPAEALLAMSELFGVSINELLSGKSLSEAEYRQTAEENLKQTVKTSSFTLKDRIDFYKNKWLKEHRVIMILIGIGIVQSPSAKKLTANFLSSLYHPVSSVLESQSDHGKLEFVYPKWNGITILRRNARTILIVPIIAELLNLSLFKTINPIIKTITSKTDHALKYPNPYTKHILNNTAKIRADSINASLLFPLAYQQTKANNGETAVKPNQIIA